MSWHNNCCSLTPGSTGSRTPMNMSGVAYGHNHPIEIQQISARIGAEISGITLSGDLDAETVQIIRKALLQHRVIFFRNQVHLDDAEHERFTALLGELLPHPTVAALKNTKAMLELDVSRGGGQSNQWHTDLTFMDAYP